MKNDKEIKLFVWDTAGAERFRSGVFRAMKSVEGIALVFDVTSKVSFNNINIWNIWLDETQENFSNPNLILLGNKTDNEKDKWQVTQEEIDSFILFRHLQKAMKV